MNSVAPGRVIRSKIAAALVPWDSAVPNLRHSSWNLNLVNVSLGCSQARGALDA